MALLFRSSVDSEARWKPQLARLMPELEVRIWPEIGDPAEIDYALVWRPEPGLLASLPNLKLILSLGAGVDHILTDPHLPRGVPIVRLVDPYMTDAMSEYVVLQVLRLHRQDLDYRAQQERRDLAGARPEERGRAHGRHSRLRRARTGCRPQAQGIGFRCRAMGKAAKNRRGAAWLCGQRRPVRSARPKRDPRLPVAADRRNGRDIEREHVCHAAEGGGADQRRPRAGIWSKRICSRPSPPAGSRPPCSTSFVTSRCPPAIPSGTTRASS